MKKADIIIISSLLALGLSLLIIFGLFAPVGATARIYIKNELVDELPLNADTVKTYTTEKGYNTVEIKDGVVFVSTADCKNQVCVKKGKINLKGETIACTPHLFLVEVK